MNPKDHVQERLSLNESTNERCIQYASLRTTRRNLLQNALKHRQQKLFAPWSRLDCTKFL